MKIKKCLLLFPLLLCTCTSLAACNHQDASTSTSVTTEAPSNIQIKVTSTIKEVSVGNTITIRVLVSGTAKRDVVWSSSDETIATVEGGRVTGISEGKAEIKIALAADPSIYTSVEVTVIAANKPTSVKINGEGNGLGWVGEDTTISVTITPENADPRLTYKSSDETVATIDENGKISFLKTGEVEITVTSTSDPTVFDKKTYEVKKGMFFTNKGGYADNMDYSHQADKEAYIQTKNKLIEGDNPAAMAWFNAMPSTKYYAEVTFNILASTSDGWTRVGIGNGSNDNDTRGFYFSPKEGQKTVMMDFPNTWGAAASRSMIWQVNGICDMDPTNLTMGILRDGNNYYYTINGSLYWYELNNRFNEMGTLPVVLSKDTSFTASDAKYVNDEATLNAMLQSAELDKKFFNSGTSTGQVTVVSNTEFKFNNKYSNEENYRFRDQCVKSYGDKGMIGGNFTIEFDVEGYENFVDDINSMLGVALRRYDTDEPVVCDSIMLDEQSFHFRTWNYDSQFSYGTIAKASYNSSKFESLTKDLATIHVKIERIVGSISSTFKVYLNGTEYTFFDADNNEKVLKINYTGKYLIMIGANHAKGTVKNFDFKEIESK